MSLRKRSILRAKARRRHSCTQSKTHSSEAQLNISNKIIKRWLSPLKSKFGTLNPFNQFQMTLLVHLEQKTTSNDDSHCQAVAAAFLRASLSSEAASFAEKQSLCKKKQMTCPTWSIRLTERHRKDLLAIRSMTGELLRITLDTSLEWSTTRTSRYANSAACSNSTSRTSVRRLTTWAEPSLKAALVERVAWPIAQTRLKIRETLKWILDQSTRRVPSVKMTQSSTSIWLGWEPSTRQRNPRKRMARMMTTSSKMALRKTYSRKQTSLIECHCCKSSA